MNARQKAKYYKQKYENLSAVGIDVKPYTVKAYSDLNPVIADGLIKDILAKKFLPIIKENMTIKCYECDPQYTGARYVFFAEIYIGKYEENV